jgi:hypothetical protein
MTAIDSSKLPNLPLQIHERHILRLQTLHRLAAGAGGERLLIGIISIADLERWIIATQRMTIDQLEKYIAGGYPG